MKDAERAGLTQRNGPWKAHPRNMLFAAAIRNGAKWFCSEVLLGTPVPLEPDPPDDVDLETGEIIETEVRVVHEPPEGYEPNWAAFWATARDLGWEKDRVHALFGVPPVDGALKAWAEAHEKPLPQVVAEMTVRLMQATTPEPDNPPPSSEVSDPVPNPDPAPDSQEAAEAAGEPEPTSPSTANDSKAAWDQLWAKAKALGLTKEAVYAHFMVRNAAGLKMAAEARAIRTKAPLEEALAAMTLELEAAHAPKAELVVEQPDEWEQHLRDNPPEGGEESQGELLRAPKGAKDLVHS
jgi:hypothetical protein